MDWDVIIVGAGPGGSTAARFAAEGGARTLLLEKRTEIGVPVRCGEGIAPRWLEMVGVEVEGDWVVNRVRGARIYSPNGTCLTVDDDNLGTEVGAVISRAGLDQHLADLAADAGAEVRTGTTVTELLRDGDAVTGVCIRNLNGSKEELRCGVVVGADGFESQVGRWAGLPTHRKPADMCGALQYTMVDLDIDPQYCEFYLAKGSKGAYIWSFPKTASESNVGIGCMLSRVKQPGKIKDLLDSFIADHPDFADGRIIDTIAGGVSLSEPLEKTAAAGVMLVGDAARQIDSITGGGVANACLSGREAGRVAAAATVASDFSEEFLQAYERSWREEMEDRLYHSYLAKTKLTEIEPGMIDAVVATMVKVGVDEPTVQGILEVLEEHHPEILAKVGAML